MGFPIRKFSDQSLFAAPQDLSQRTTSFIASQRQGIHRIPFWHLIVLITKKRFCVSAIGIASTTLPGFEKTSFASNTSGSFAVKRSPRLRCSNQPAIMNMWLRRPRGPCISITPGLSTECVSSSRCQIKRRFARRRVERREPLQTRRDAHSETRMSCMTQELKDEREPVMKPVSSTAWWSQTGSNRRPHACKARALPTELWPPSKCVAFAGGAAGYSQSEWPRAPTAVKNTLYKTLNKNGGPGRT